MSAAFHCSAKKMVRSHAVRYYHGSSNTPDLYLPWSSPFAVVKTRAEGRRLVGLPFFLIFSHGFSPFFFKLFF